MEGLDHISSTSTFKATTAERQAPNQTALKANRTCTDESHKTIANKGSVVNRQQALAAGYPPQGLEQRERIKVPTSQSFSGKGLIAYFTSAP